MTWELQMHVKIIFPHFLFLKCQNQKYLIYKHILRLALIKNNVKHNEPSLQGSQVLALRFLSPLTPMFRSFRVNPCRT